MKNKNTPVKNTDTYTHKSQFCLYGSGLSYVLTTVHHKSKVSSVSFGGKRGKIKNFSAKSARRLRAFIFSLLYPARYMITLTYPLDFPAPKEAKKHLRVFVQALLRRFGDGVVWKLEPQKRGAPHFHLLFWTKYEDVKALRKWVSQKWFEIVNSGDEKHFKAGTRVDVLDSKKKIFLYVSKYVAKVENTAWEEPGRFWGKAGKLPVAPTSDLIYLARQEYIQLRRLIRRWLKSLGYKLKFFNKIFRLHINMDGYWLQRLLRFVLGEPVELLYAYSFYSPP